MCSPTHTDGPLCRPPAATEPDTKPDWCLSGENDQSSAPGRHFTQNARVRGAAGPFPCPSPGLGAGSRSPAPPGALAQPRGRNPGPRIPRIPSAPSPASPVRSAPGSPVPRPTSPWGLRNNPRLHGPGPKACPRLPPPRGISPPPPAGVQVKTRESRFLLASPSPPSPGDGFSSPSHASLARPLRPAPLRNGPRAPAAATRTLRLRLLTPSLPSVPTTVPAPAGVSRQFRQRLPHSRCAYGALPPVLVSSHSGPPPPRSAAVSELGRSANPTESLRPTGELGARVLAPPPLRHLIQRPPDAGPLPAPAATPRRGALPAPAPACSAPPPDFLIAFIAISHF